MTSTLIIRVVAGLIAITVLLLFVVFYIGLLYRTLKKCSPQARTMQPGVVWLLLIPLFNLIWSFLVVFALADSLANEFRFRKISTTDPKPGKGVGTAMAVCGACSIIPFVNALAIPAHVILWIVYWVKIAGFSKQLDFVSAQFAVPGYPQ